MSDLIEKIVAEIRRASVSSVPDELATFDKLNVWADRLDSLRQVPEGGWWATRTLAQRLEERIRMLRVEGSIPPNGYTFGQEAAAAKCREIADMLEHDLADNPDPPTATERQAMEATPAQAGAELPELRWLTRSGWDGPERVLQYKNRKDDWEDVPEAQ